MIPYGRHSIGDDDIKSVVEILKSDWLTTGPMVEKFENAVANFVGAKHGIAVSSGTAALHCAMYASGIGPGDEVIVSSLTFAATANCVCYMGGVPVFADVEEATLLIDPDKVEEKITSRTRAIIGVDYAGQPCNWNRLREISDNNDLVLISDACHALGAEYKERKVGSIADMTVFSFHPAKLISTGEGGMIVTNNSEYDEKLRIFRNHGITTDVRQREKSGSWKYEMVELGYNYRLNDIQCALGISQLKKISRFLKRRKEIAGKYDTAFSNIPGITPVYVVKDSNHAYHLYVIRIKKNFGRSRDELLLHMRNKGIGVNVHYLPVYLHPFYKQKFQYSEGICPVSEHAYDEILSLPIFPDMRNEDLDYVINQIKEFKK
jgi:perosamine synthetase